MAEKPVLDDSLIEECQREQQRSLGYSDTRDVIARAIAQLLETYPDIDRDRIVSHVGWRRVDG
jgi:hypothetical protein